MEVIKYDCQRRDRVDDMTGTELTYKSRYVLYKTDRNKNR